MGSTGSVPPLLLRLLRAAEVGARGAERALEGVRLLRHCHWLLLRRARLLRHLHWLLLLLRHWLLLRHLHWLLLLSLCRLRRPAFAAWALALEGVRLLRHWHWRLLRHWHWLLLRCWLLSLFRLRRPALLLRPLPRARRGTFEFPLHVQLVPLSVAGLARTSPVPLPGRAASTGSLAALSPPCPIC